MSQSPEEEALFAVPPFNPDFEHVVCFARKIAEKLNIEPDSLTFQPVQHAGVPGVLIDDSWAMFWKQGVPDSLITDSKPSKFGNEPDWAFIVASKEIVKENEPPKSRLQQVFYPDCDFSFTVTETNRNWALAMATALGRVNVDRITHPFMDMLAKRQ